MQEPGNLHLLLLLCKRTCGIHQSVPRFQQPNRLRGRKGRGWGRLGLTSKGVGQVSIEKQRGGAG